MSAGGLTYGVSKSMLSSVVSNGVDPTDPRVLSRTNEATNRILGLDFIPVNSMATYDVQASGTTLLLPPQLENAIEVEVLGGASVNGQMDVVQGWNLVTNFIYVDPSAAHDNPLVDQFLKPDPNDPTILRRQYDYPGLNPNSTVRVTGAKRFVPITGDSDYLIVQNVLALKYMIQAIEADENNDHQGSEAFEKRCFETLQMEVKKHQLDPTNSLKRKGHYEADLVNYARETFGWTRARLAFELPMGLQMGKSELTRTLEQAEMRLMDRGQWIGTVQEYEVKVTYDSNHNPVSGGVTSGHILCPKEVEAIVAASIAGMSMDIKSIYMRYIQHGHHWWTWWSLPELRDEGEIRDSDGDMRRSYRLCGTSDTIPHTLKFIGVLRWIKKSPTDYMTVRNFEALRLMCMSIIEGKTPETKQLAEIDEQKAIQEVDDELGKYLAGQMIVAPVDFGFFGRRCGVRHGVI